MPRRRMLDPDIWNDSRVKKVSPTERLLFIGMISYADDEGRLLANPAYLRSKIFPYDDFTLEQIIDMRTHILETNPNVALYENGGEDYLYFKKWSRYQKPSHPQESKLPEPPEDAKIQEEVKESIQDSVKESLHPQTGTVPSQVRLGQSSLGKVSIGKVSIGQEDFTEFLNSEKDLTDFLTRTLKEYAPRGPTHTMGMVKKLWHQATGREIGDEAFQVIYLALKKYPIPVLAVTLAKVVKYAPGKRKPGNYIQAVLDEQLKEYEKKHTVKGPAPPQ